MKHKKPEEKTHERLASLDTLRGFDMFWIIGGGSLIIALAQATGWGWLEIIAEQMHHVPWQGYHWEDQIFPMFMFISGVAIPYAITAREFEKGENRYNLFVKACQTRIDPSLFGVIYNGIFGTRIQQCPLRKCSRANWPWLLFCRYYRDLYQQLQREALLANWHTDRYCYPATCCSGTWLLGGSSIRLEGH